MEEDYHIIVPLECSSWMERAKGFQVSDEEPERLVEGKDIFYKFKLKEVV